MCDFLERNHNKNIRPSSSYQVRAIPARPHGDEETPETQGACRSTRKLARFLNVESVDIYGNVFDPSSEAGPQLSVTKQVSSRVAVTYTKGLSRLSQQMVMVSYRILSFLYLECETDQQAQGGIDLKFRYSH